MTVDHWGDLKVVKLGELMAAEMVGKKVGKRAD